MVTASPPAADSNAKRGNHCTTRLSHSQSTISASTPSTPSRFAPSWRLNTKTSSRQARVFPCSTVSSRSRRGLLLLNLVQPHYFHYIAKQTNHPPVSTRRQALGPFQFSDGTKLSPGDWACTPVRAIMQNEALYPAPLEFHGFRFVDRDNVSIHTPEGAQRFQIQQEKPSSLCSADATWHVWGSGRMVW
jgi:hypothetical protein